MKEFLQGLYSGVISGIVASGMFYYFVSLLKPDIKIAPGICKTMHDGNLIFGFKIVNYSFWSALDLKAELCIMSPFNSPGGMNYDLKWIKLRKSELAHCSRYTKNDTRGAYAIIFLTTENLEQVWCNIDQILLFKINAKHSFSGFVKSSEQHFYTKKSSIKEGFFNFCKSFEIS